MTFHPLPSKNFPDYGAHVVADPRGKPVPFGPHDNQVSCKELSIVERLDLRNGAEVATTPLASPTDGR